MFDRGGDFLVAVIDGPCEVAGLSDVLERLPTQIGAQQCDAARDNGCAHGTFVIGLLGARRDAVVPGLCPDCRLLHIPLSFDEAQPRGSVKKLAEAVRIAVSAGARLINLSLAVLGADEADPDLAVALDYASAGNTVLIVAAGNQAQLMAGQLLVHQATIPVVAVDAAHRLLPDSNFGPELSGRGLAAFGQRVAGYGPDGQTTVMSGTSVAAAIVTGILADLWLARPDVSAAEILAIVASLGPRNGAIPPMLTRATFLEALDQIPITKTVLTPPEVRRSFTPYAELQGDLSMSGESGAANARSVRAEFDRTAASPLVRAAGSSPSCTCGGGSGGCTCNEGKSPRHGFVYAIGTVEAEYPNVGVEREMQAFASGIPNLPGLNRGIPKRLIEDRRWQHAVLTDNREAARYLARQLTWKLIIEDDPMYILTPRDFADYDGLVDCLAPKKSPVKSAGKQKAKAPPEYAEEGDGSRGDLNVVVGLTPDGTNILTDQVFTIDSGQLKFPGAEYFEQLADNPGLQDEDRAYNYVLARYATSRQSLGEINKEFELSGVPTLRSRLSNSGRRVVRVIFTFCRRADSAIERKFFVRVDVTDKFPFIVTPWHQYLERGGAT
jgi:PatG C-terminal/Subtilase family/PatG Domain